MHNSTEYHRKVTKEIQRYLYGESFFDNGGLVDEGIAAVLAAEDVQPYSDPEGVIEGYREAEQQLATLRAKSAQRGDTIATLNEQLATRDERIKRLESAAGGSGHDACRVNEEMLGETIDSLVMRMVDADKKLSKALTVRDQHALYRLIGEAHVILREDS